MRKVVLYTTCIIAILFVAGCTSASTDSYPKPRLVKHPASASDVAKQLNCTNFKDLGPAELGGTVDSGSCWIGNKKYAINTFDSQYSRDLWLKSAEQLGVVPKWETDTSVTYPSVG